MTAKLKMYPRRIGWIGWNDGNRFHWKKRENGHQARVRVTDARELTAEKAVEKALQSLFNAGVIAELLFNAARRAGMVADVTIESRVRVRRAKK